MLSKRYIPTNIESLNYEEKLVKHYKKLEEIQREDRKKKNVEKEVVEKAKFTESREKAIKFHISERTNAIEKDNELLLGRLVEISRKKPSALATIKSEPNLPRTLNGPSRRREKNRIAAENEAFARRLLSQQPSFNPKKLESDYEKHHQRVKNMAKLTHLSPRKVRLPPIKYADFDNAKNNKKGVKNAKKEQKKHNNDYEVEAQPEEVSPVKAQSQEDVSIKSPVTDSNVTKNDGVKDSHVDNREAEERAAKEKTEREEREKEEREKKEREAKEKEAKEKAEQEAREKAEQEALNKPVEDQKQPISAANVDNKSQVLQDNQQPQSATNNDDKVENNSPSNNAVVDDKSPDTKPVEEASPNEEIQDDIKEADN